jgi:hypothetical protein
MAGLAEVFADFPGLPQTLPDVDVLDGCAEPSAPPSVEPYGRGHVVVLPDGDAARQNSLNSALIGIE